MDHNMNTEPKLDALTATNILENIFEEAEAAPSTIPVEALAAHQNLRRSRFGLQRAVLVVVIILWLLLPLLFLTPKYSVSEPQMNDRDEPVYTVEMESFLPVRTMKAYINGKPLQLYEKDSKTFAVEPGENGTMEILITAVNRQTTVSEVEVTAVKEFDETGVVDLGDDDVPLAGFDPAIINGDRDGDIHIPWLVALLVLLLGYAGYFLRYQTRIFELRREIAAVEQTLRKERWK